MSTMYHNKRYLELNMDQEISYSVLYIIIVFLGERRVNNVSCI